MSKRLTASHVLNRIGGKLLATYIRFVYYTSKVTLISQDTRDIARSHIPFIMSMWHGQFMLLPALKPDDIKFKAMVARHSDAEIIGHALLNFDMDLVRGAGAGKRRRDRGGAKALRLSLKALQENYSVALTADVPPGPARKAGHGIIKMAKLSGRPIIPTAVATSKFMTSNTWSRFTINLPFSKIVFIIGNPIHVQKNANQDECEAARIELENSMNNITEKAYELSGADISKASPISALPKNIRLSRNFTLKAYKTITQILQPITPFIISRRAKKGKEDLSRKNERLGKPITARPNGKLIWFHAASVGETNAILPLMHELQKQRPDLHQLLTTGTVTSANIAGKRLPEGALHQYIPIDIPNYIDSFLSHWKPDTAFFAESEIWPNLIIETGKRNIPLILLNGTMSEKSFKTWRKRAEMARIIFSQFSMMLVQNRTLEKRFRKLGTRKIHNVGNLKIDAPLLPIDTNELNKLKLMFKNKKIFLAASTHAGEDEIIAKAHKLIKKQIPDFLTIIAPRHPERATDIIEKLQEINLKVTRRTTDKPPYNEADIYLADTIGEMGLFYSLAQISFLGGSLIPHGGQNPIEAIKLNSAILTGPHWHNFNDIYNSLRKQNAVKEVNSELEIADIVLEYFNTPTQIDNSIQLAKNTIEELSGALQKTLTLITPYLPPQNNITEIERAS